MNPKPSNQAEVFCFEEKQGPHHKPYTLNGPIPNPYSLNRGSQPATPPPTMAAPPPPPPPNFSIESSADSKRVRSIIDALPGFEELL